jgi:pyruvate/2-oxoglutarate dehydrogenase complex dihydrolipoamide acyltransferase (E2) component
MTDKAPLKLLLPKSGTIESLLAKDGDMIQVGKGLVMINEGGASASALKLQHRTRTSCCSKTCRNC